MYAIKINRFFFLQIYLLGLLKKKKKNLLRSIFKEETVLFFFYGLTLFNFTSVTCLSDSQCSMVVIEKDNESCGSLE